MSTDIPEGSEPRSPEAIEADIARQRQQLAGTVEALSHKLDVKAQAKAKVTHLQDRATTPTGRPRPDLAVPAALLAGAVVALILWRRRR